MGLRLLSVYFDLKVRNALFHFSILQKITISNWFYVAVKIMKSIVFNGSLSKGAYSNTETGANIMTVSHVLLCQVDLHCYLLISTESIAYFMRYKV